MDPIFVLKDFVVAGELDKVIEKGDNAEIDFGGRCSYENTAPTGYKSMKGKGAFYDLRSVLFFARSIGPDFTYMEYFKAANKNKELGTIKLIDHKDLEGFLTGTLPAPENLIQNNKTSYAGVQEVHDAKRTSLDAAGTTVEVVPNDAAAERSALRSILINERQLRDRNTMLSIPGRSFQRVLDLLMGVYSEDAALRTHEQTVKDQANRAARDKAFREKAKAASGPRPSGRYQRETDTDAGLKQMGVQNLGVQQVGFAAAAPVADAQPIASHSLQAAKRPRTSVAVPLPSGSVQHSVTSSKATVTHHVSKESHPRPPPVIPGPGRSLRAPKPNGTPIIMVPPATTAILNMLNAQQFLETGSFVSPQEAEAAGAQRHGYLRAMRTLGRDARHPVKYHVTDREPSNEADWKRVVAVFCLGKPWQFKTWPFKGAATGDLVETFQHVAGVHLHYADEPVEPAVKKWNVKMLKIARHNRNNDETVAREFWAFVDAFLQARNSTLLY